MKNFNETYQVIEGVMNIDGVKATNGLFKPVKHLRVHSKEGVFNMVVVKFNTVSNNMEVEKEIPLKDIKSTALLKYIPEEFIFYIGTKKFQENFIRNKILHDLENLSIDEIYTLNQGHNIIEGKHIFCLGNCIVNSINSTHMKQYASSSYKLLKCSNEKGSYLEWIYKFCSLDKDNMPVLLLSVTVAIIRPLLKRAGIDNLFVTYIYGETGKGKSTYSKLLTEIYANTKNYLTLSSDITGLRELMLQTKDFVMLADDLNISGSSRVKDSKEAKISEIIQQAANGDKVKYKGEESYFEGLLFVTAEYVLKNQSTINRCILVNVTEQMNTDTLDFLKERQGLYIKFLKDFIWYIYNNFEDNVKHINDYNATTVEKSIKEDAFAGIMRIKRTEKILTIAFNIMLNFFKTKLLLPNDNCNRFSAMFKNAIANCIYNTKEHVKREDATAGREYINEILALIDNAIYYNKYPFYYAKSYKIYQKRKKQNRPCYLFADNGCICFKGDEILDYFNNLEDFKYAVSKKAISAQLKYHGLLKCKFGEYSFPCRSANNKTRYYHIYIDQLADLMYPHEYDSELRQAFIDMLQE